MNYVQLWIVGLWLITSGYVHANYSMQNLMYTDTEAFGTMMPIRAATGKVKGRDYHLSIADTEKKCIRRIINKLARDSWVSILGSKSSLEKDGDKIDHIHPFRFLEYTLNNEELKTGMLAIRERGGLFWSGFIDGLTDTLAEESRQHNLSAYVAEFARNIKLDVKIMARALDENRWKDFVNTLLDNLPRKNNPNRYDM